MKNQILEKIACDQRLEGRWLNTLSLLEHIGARKIGKTVFQSHPSLPILEHHADESRHAYIFKKMAADLGAGEADYLCAEEGIRYFQDLDHGIAEWISKNIPQAGTYENYLLTTCLIERRAMKLYPVYKNATRRPSIASEMAAVIAEETNHRHHIEEETKKILQRAGGTLAPLLELEENLFTGFETALEKVL